MLPHNMFGATIGLFLLLISEYVQKSKCVDTQATKTYSKLVWNFRSIYDKLHFDDILLT